MTTTYNNIDNIEYIIIHNNIPKSSSSSTSSNNSINYTYNEYIEKGQNGSIKLCNIPNELCDDNLIRIFVEKCPYNIEFVDNPTEELCKIVLDKNAFAVQRIKNKALREKYIVKAVKKCPQIIHNIHKICDMNNISKKLLEEIDDFTQIQKKSHIITPKILTKIFSNKKCIIII